MDDNRENDAGDEKTVPFDAIPDPVSGYSVRDEEPTLERANGAFRSAFGESESGTPVREWWASCGVRSVDSSVERLCAALRAGERVDIEVALGPESGAETTTYRLRSSAEPASDGRESGYLVLTPIPSGSDNPVDVDQIASVISHELRNPLDVAKAHLTAARERGDEEHFEQLADAHDRMEQIIRDVLTLARSEDAISPSPDVDLGTVARDAWTTVDTTNASLSVEDDLPTIDADRDRLRRLFENLFRNSVEHALSAEPTGDGGSDADAALDVRVGDTADHGFYVADDGAGIPPAERSRAFEPGYSSDDSGVGLGLAIVDQIAQAHGWTVSITSGAGGGARFEFRDVETGE
jgi:signal transduction histidine kinase